MPIVDKIGENSKVKKNKATMAHFMKIKNGGVFCVTVLNTDQRVGHGYSVISPKLKLTNKRTERFDNEWEENSSEIEELYKSIDRTETSKNNTTRKRMDKIEEVIRQLKNEEKRAMHQDL